MGFKIKSIGKIVKKIAPIAAPVALAVGGGVVGAAAYQKFAPMAKAYMQNRRATARAAEQEELYPSVAPPMQFDPLPGGSASATAYRPAATGFWGFLAKLFGMG